MYTEKQKWALEQFDLLAQQEGSQNKACERIKMSTAVISSLRNGTYKGNAERKLNQLISYFETKQASEDFPAPVAGYVPTSVSTQIYDIIRNCQLHGGLAVACGDAGIGKTQAAKQFVIDHPNEAVYVALNPCLTNLKALLKLLCRQSGSTERTVDEMWLSLTRKLHDGMVVIVDEAQHMPIRPIEALRALTDYFADRGQTLGVCFVGNTETVNQFGGRKKAEFAQIINRTRQRKVFTTNHITKDDMRALFPALADKGPEIDFLHGVARSSQAVRGAVILYSNALDNGDVSYDGLYAMAKHMALDIAI